jgi:hypothetical protein
MSDVKGALRAPRSGHEPLTSGIRENGTMPFPTHILFL